MTGEWTLRLACHVDRGRLDPATIVFTSTWPTRQAAQKESITQTERASEALARGIALTLNTADSQYVVPPSRILYVDVTIVPPNEGTE